MSAIGFRFAIAVAVVVVGHIPADAADITPPSEKQSPRGVAEYADELADGERSEKPLIAWMHPFTERIAYGSYGNFGRTRMHGAILPPKPPVYLEDELDLTVMQPTAIERLIAQGYGTGDGSIAGKRSPVERRPDISNHLAN